MTTMKQDEHRLEPHDPFAHDDFSCSSESELVVHEVDSEDSSAREIKEVRRLTEGDNDSIEIWRNVILFMVRLSQLFVW